MTFHDVLMKSCNLDYSFDVYDAFFCYVNDVFVKEQLVYAMSVCYPS